MNDYLLQISPLIKTGLKSIVKANEHLRKGNLYQAVADYRQSFENIIHTKRNWPNNTWPEKYYLINQYYKFVYCPIPKVACSSIKESFLKLTDTSDKDTVINTRGLIHRYMQQNFSLNTFYATEAKKIITSDQYFKFVFVRNPWSRIVSAYSDKFVHHLDLKNEVFVKRVIDEVYRTRELTPDYEKGITFRQFLEYINVTDDHELNSHWKPQYLFLGDINFDFIGKFETISQDFEYLSTRLNIKFDLPWSHKAKYDQKLDLQKDYSGFYAQNLRQMGVSPTYQYFFPPDLKALFLDRYRQDISQFGYCFNLLE